MLSRRLKKKGFEIIIAGDGQEGIAEYVHNVLLGFVNDQPIVQGELNMKITSILPAGKSSIQTLSLPLPLGLDLEQSPEDGLIKVVDISGTGSADGENIQIQPHVPNSAPVLHFTVCEVRHHIQRFL